MLILALMVVYLAAAVGLFLGLIHEERNQAYESTPLSWPWLLTLAIAWPVVLYELLAAADRGPSAR